MKIDERIYKLKVLILLEEAKALVTKNIYIPDADLPHLIAIGKKLREQDPKIPEEKALITAIQEALKLGTKTLIEKHGIPKTEKQE